jgi:hypothetical protein
MPSLEDAYPPLAAGCPFLFFFEPALLLLALPLRLWVERFGMQTRKLVPIDGLAGVLSQVSAKRILAHSRP